MKNAVGIVAALATVGLVAGCVEETSEPSQRTIGSADDLSGFEGARAGQAEMGIRSLGFESTRSEGLTTFWYNPTTDACARITTSDGRYSDVTMVPVPNC